MKTHKKELDERIDKCGSQLLSAMGLQERKQAIECIKGALFLLMFLDAVHDKETIKKDKKEIKEKIKKTKEKLDETAEHYKKAHCIKCVVEKKPNKRRSRRSGDDDNADEDGEGEEGEEEEEEDKEKDEDEDEDEDEEEEEEMVAPCEDMKRLMESEQKYKEAQNDMQLFKKSIKKSKSVREYLFRFTKSLGIRDSKDRMLTFVDFYKEIMKSKTFQDNKFLVQKVKKVTNKVKAKHGDNPNIEASEILNDYHEQQAYEMFASGAGQDFVRNLIEMSKLMTAVEVRMWAQDLAWVRGFVATERASDETNKAGEPIGIDANGSGDPADGADNDGDGSENVEGE